MIFLEEGASGNTTKTLRFCLGLICNTYRIEGTRTSVAQQWERRSWSGQDAVVRGLVGLDHAYAGIGIDGH